MVEREDASKVYYLLAVSGIFQRWSDHTPRVLTDPRPFRGYVSGVEWGFTIDEPIDRAHRFAKAGTLPFDADSFGPWWYRVTDQHWVEVTETTAIARRVLPA